MLYVYYVHVVYIRMKFAMCIYLVSYAGVHNLIVPSSRVITIYSTIV